MSRVWHITGANTGLGLALALKALSEGDRVIAAVRTPSKVPENLQRPNVKVLRFDLAWDQDTMNEYAERAFGAFGQVDVLVNNAGFAYMGAIEESEDDKVKAQFDINVFAPLRLIRATLPHLRAQASGTIMNLSSLGAHHGLPSNGVYCATKAAVSSLTETLMQEVSPFNIRCVVVEPGYFRTSFLAGPASGANVAPAMGVYEGTAAGEARRALGAYDGRQPGDPAEGAARMWEYVAGEGLFREKRRLLRLPLGSDCGAVIKAHVEGLEEVLEEYGRVIESTDFGGRV